MIVQIAVVIFAGLLGWAYVASKPSPPKVCGSPGGPPITSPRVRLSDGRHLAYKEAGVSKKDAKYKIIVIHGFDSSKDLNLPVSQELIEELRIYFLSFDRAGYGESDPHPMRSVKSEAFDIQELADKLQIGPKFYVIGVSMGAYPVWSCLKYIPHRLSGASLVVPFVNYWWPCIPANLSKEALNSQLVQDHIMEGNTAILSRPDLEMLKKLSDTPSVGQEKVRQQGVYESLFRDIMAGYGKWEFDPTDIKNPFPNHEGSVQIWQGSEDKIVSRKLNHYLSEKLPWVQYHEVPDAGHLLIFNSSLCEAIIRELLHE